MSVGNESQEENHPYYKNQKPPTFQSEVLAQYDSCDIASELLFFRILWCRDNGFLTHRSGRSRWHWEYRCNGRGPIQAGEVVADDLVIVKHKREDSDDHGKDIPRDDTSDLKNGDVRGWIDCLGRIAQQLRRI